MSIGKEEYFGISILNSEEDIAGRHHEALRNCPDLQRQLASMLVHNVPPTGLVEELVLRIVKVLAKELFCLVDHLIGDHWANQVLLQYVLKAKEENLFELPPSAFKIGEDKLSPLAIKLFTP